MGTLRDVMLANIEDAKAKVTSLEAELAKMDAEGGSFLDREVGELQSWLQGLASHVFSRGQVPVSPKAASATIASESTSAPSGSVVEEQPAATEVTATASADASAPASGAAVSASPVEEQPAATAG